MHQLDECLQTAKVSVARDRIGVELTLTPGVLVAPAVLNSIDRDGDGNLSPIEIRDYAGKVVSDLVIRVDGTPQTMTLIEADAASSQELGEGVGTIRLVTHAVTPRLRSGAHRVEFANNHRAVASVYLVNALVPDDPAITIGMQQRDRLQRTVSIDVDIASSIYPLAMLAILAVALAARAGSGVFRRMRQAASAHHR